MFLALTDMIVYLTLYSIAFWPTISALAYYLPYLAVRIFLLEALYPLDIYLHIFPYFHLFPLFSLSRPIPSRGPLFPVRTPIFPIMVYYIPFWLVFTTFGL